MAYDAKIILNVMPWFKDGIHDRVLTAAGHGAVILSDETSALDELLGDSYVSFSLERLEDLSDKIGKVLRDTDYAQKLVGEAYTRTIDSCSYEAFAAMLCESCACTVTK